MRIVLGVWVASLLARIAGVPVVSRLFDVMPFHHQIQIFRYAAAAWLLPCCILAAHAVDHPAPRRLVRSAAAALLALAAASAWLAWPLVRQVPTAPLYLAAAAAWAVLTLAASLVVGAGRDPRRSAAILLADMAVLFMAPMAAGARRPALDAPAIEFLQRNLGLQRFTTLEPFQANYGALFGAASVNYNYLPTPALWAAYVEAHLRPGVSPVRFLGNLPADVPGQPANAQILADHLRDYADTGVRYILVAGGLDPFSPPPRAFAGEAEAFPLDAGMTLSGSLGPSPIPIRAMTVLVGTYAGLASGLLEMELCAGALCARGEADLATAPDNEPLEIRLDRELPAGADLAWTLRHRGGDQVAIWRAPGADGPQPVLAVLPPPAPGAPTRAYADRLLTIFEIADPAPYFSATGGSCELTPHGREAVEARCDAPATLIRRELRMPGWTARVNGAPLEPAAAGEVFQSVPLPQGASRATFAYVPPGAPFYLALFTLGASGLLPWHRAPAWRRKLRRPARPRPRPAGAPPTTATSPRWRRCRTP